MAEGFKNDTRKVDISAIAESARGLIKKAEQVRTECREQDMEYWRGIADGVRALAISCDAGEGLLETDAKTKVQDSLAIDNAKC